MCGSFPGYVYTEEGKTGAPSSDPRKSFDDEVWSPGTSRCLDRVGWLVG